MGPTWLGNRLCMDGGICQTSTHCDVIAGVDRALVISLTDGSADASKIGLRTSGLPNTLQQEVKDLEAGGTKTVLKVVGLLPGTNRSTASWIPNGSPPASRTAMNGGLPMRTKCAPSGARPEAGRVPKHRTEKWCPIFGEIRCEDKGVERHVRA